MEAAWIGVVLGIAAFAVWWGVQWGDKTARARSGEGLEELARRLGGTVSEAAVVFAVGGRRARCLRWIDDRGVVTSLAEVELASQGYFVWEDGERQTSDSAWAQALLDRGLREILDDLDGFRVWITPDSLGLERVGYLGVGGLANLCAILSHLLGIVEPFAKVPGVELGELRGDRCGVCRREGAALRCESCAVPVHPDCWSWLGRCPVFGCAGRRGLRE